MRLEFQEQSQELLCFNASGALLARKTLDLTTLQSWAKSYGDAIKSDHPNALAVIGRAIADWLNKGDNALKAALDGGGEFTLEIVTPAIPCELGQALLDVPWEVLAPNGVFLAADSARLFVVFRRLGNTLTPAPPQHRDLTLLFMAAEVEGERVILNFEKEETAILQATAALKMQVMVEESGCIDFLGERLAQEKGVEIVHLSCHGNIDDTGPYLALETMEGALDEARAERVYEALGADGNVPLVVLSACRTAEQTSDASASFIQELVRAGVPNVLGWDGSVHDGEAIRFAEVFYHKLALNRSVPHAAAIARRTMLEEFVKNPQGIGRHWHLARVILGPKGGGPLCASGKPARPFVRDAGFKEFLDTANRRVPVATASQFVGRRRSAQRILRAFRDGDKAGVLIQGMGNLGKSSLAARIANRMSHHKVVVLYEKYGPLRVFEAVKSALPPDLRKPFEDKWSELIRNDTSALQDALQEALDGPFNGFDSDSKPILLIIDDLEQSLDTPQADKPTTFKTAADTAVFAAIIGAFRDATTESRLLITSRYTFQLTDRNGKNLAEKLALVPLPSMDEAERKK